MSIKRDNNINNREISHPGKRLFRLINANNSKQTDIAARMGIAPKTLNEIIKGKNPITPATAIKLEYVFQITAGYWMNLQAMFDEHKARLEEEVYLQKQFEILKKYHCYSDLEKYGYVPSTKSKEEKVKYLLSFFGVSSLETATSLQLVGFRKQGIKNASLECLAAWLRCGEIEAAKIETLNFNASKARDSVERLKKLSRKPIHIAASELVEICASFGVAVVFVPHFKNTAVNGATRWLSADKALIQLTARGTYSDIFWFSFFHEMGHILLHPKKERFVEIGNLNTDEATKESEANNFAANSLIDPKSYREFLENNDYTRSSIIRFAEKLGVSVAVVAGRIAFDKILPWSRISNLRTKIKIQHSSS